MSRFSLVFSTVSAQTHFHSCHGDLTGAWAKVRWHPMKEQTSGAIMETVIR